MINPSPVISYYPIMALNYFFFCWCVFLGFSLELNYSVRFSCDFWSPILLLLLLLLFKLSDYSSVDLTVLIQSVCVFFAISSLCLLVYWSASILFILWYSVFHSFVQQHISVSKQQNIHPLTIVYVYKHIYIKQLIPVN